MDRLMSQPEIGNECTGEKLHVSLMHKWKMKEWKSALLLWRDVRPSKISRTLRLKLLFCLVGLACVEVLTSLARSDGSLRMTAWTSVIHMI